MAIIGNGAQSEFQALGFKALLRNRGCGSTTSIRWATREVRRQPRPLGFDLVVCANAEEAVAGADIVTTVTADKHNATILTDKHVGRRHAHQRRRRRLPRQDRAASRHAAALDVFVEYPPQTRIEGEIQQFARSSGDRDVASDRRRDARTARRARQITLFDSVGFAIEDFSALRYVHSKLAGGDFHEDLDLLADPDEPRDLLGMVHRAAGNGLPAAS